MIMISNTKDEKEDKNNEEKDDKVVTKIGHTHAQHMLDYRHK